MTEQMIRHKLFLSGISIGLFVWQALFIFPSFIERDFWRKDPLLMLLVLGFSGFYLLSFLSPLIDTLQKRLERYQLPANSPWPLILLLVMITGYAVYFSYYTILYHHHLGTAAYDFGLIQNALVNTLHGRFFYSSYFGKSLFSVHFFPIHLFWLPFYAIFPYPETLLILQSAVLAIAALPLYYLSLHLLGSRVGSLLIVFCYLINPAQHGANFSDIHELAFLPLFIFSLIYFLQKDKKSLVFLFLILSLSVKEDMALALIPVSVFFYFQKKNKVLLWSQLILCFVWYVCAQKIIVLQGGTDSSQNFSRYFSTLLPPGTSDPSGILKTIITNPFFVLKQILIPEKIIYFFQMTLPFGLIFPFILRKNFLLVAYGYAMTLLASHPPLFKITFQYVWYLIPFLFAATLFSLNHVQSCIDDNKSYFSKKIPAILVTLVLSTSILSWQYGAFFKNPYFEQAFVRVDLHDTPQKRLRLATLRQFISMMPPNASVSASESICPHLYEFQNVQTFRYDTTKPDYLLLLSPNMDNVERLQTLLSKGEYISIKNEEGFQLLAKHDPT